MELYIFGKFLVLDGKESTFEAALGEVVTLRLRSGQAATRAGDVGHAHRELAETAGY